MFGLDKLVGIAVDVTEGVAGTVVKKADDALTDPLDTVVDTTVGVVMAPVKTVVNTLDFLEGLSEGEIRKRALIRFGADALEGLALDEIMQLLVEE